MVGQTISHYKITEKLGEGGMGVVWKAEDTRLERPVALKFLTAQLLEDGEARKRFTREAIAAAALDHPNICTIHEIDEAEGQTFLAMAYVEGQSVKDKVKDRPLKLDEALGIAIQTAQGLQAAHEKGIVHRDIKSANLMVTRQGQVKILDFGLAQLAERSHLTKTATILGTPAYMSPEQVRRQPTDRRTDIWSLGVLIYELVAGHLPFEAEREEAVAYSILHEEPEPLTAQRIDVPVELDRAVRKAMAKDPTERYQHVDEFLVDLRAIQRPGTTTGGLLSAPKPGNKPRLIRILTATVVMALLLFLALSHLTPRSSETGVVRLSLMLPEGTTLASMSVAGPTPQISLSPDGRVLAYVASVSGGPPLLWTRALATVTPRELPGTEGASFPFWSPDSQFLGFFANGKLKTVDAFGGVPKVIADAPEGRGGTWNDAGDIVYAGGITTALQWVQAEGGVSRDATSLDEDNGEVSHRFPRFLPDGRHFLYVSLARGPHAGVYVASLDSEAKKQLLSGNWTTPHVVGDYLLSVQEGKLTAQPFDPVGLEVSASPVLVAEQIGAGSPSGWASLSISESGHIAYSSGRSPNRQLIWFDRLGKKLSQVGTVGEYVDPSLSADDRTVAFARVNPETGTPDIWIFDTLRGTESRLTIDSGTDVRPQWSAASRRLIFTSNRAGAWDLYEKEIDGTEPERTVTNPQSAHHKWATHWSRDGRLAVYTTTGAETGWDLWILNLDDTAESRPFLQGPFDETQGVLSPNGQWLAYASNETGRLEVYVQSFPSAGDKKQISADGGWDPKWSADGSELFFLSLDGKLLAVNVKVGSDLSPGLPEALFEVSVPRPESPYSTNYVVSSDAKRFLVNTVIPQATSSPITIVLNGLRELGER